MTGAMEGIGVSLIIGGKEVATHIVELTTKAEEVQKDIDALKAQSLLIDASSINSRLDKVERQAADMVASMGTMASLPEAVAEQIASFQAALEKKFVAVEERLLKAESSLQGDPQWTEVLKSFEAKQEKFTAEALSRIGDLEGLRSKSSARIASCEAQLASTLGQVKSMDDRLGGLSKQQNETMSILKAMSALPAPQESSALDEKVAVITQDLKQFGVELDGVKAFHQEQKDSLGQIELKYDNEIQGLRENQEQLNERIPLLLQQFSKQNAGISDLVQNMKDSQSLQSEQRMAQTQIQDDLKQLKEEFGESRKTQGAQNVTQAQMQEDLKAIKVDQLQVREMAAREAQERGAALAKASTATDSAISRFQSQLKDASQHSQETFNRAKLCETIILNEIKPQLDHLKDGLENHSHELCFAGRSGPGVMGVIRSGDAARAQPGSPVAASSAATASYAI